MKRLLPSILTVAVVAAGLNFLTTTPGFAQPSNSSRQLDSQPNPMASFVWASAEIDGKKFDKIAILIPIEISGTKKKFFMQLDTGSDGTFFYGKILRKFALVGDSSGPDMLFTWVKSLDGRSSWTSKAQIDWMMGNWDLSTLDTNSQDPGDRILGTIGSDFATGKVLVLDFPNSQYTLVDSVTQLPARLTQSVTWEKSTIIDYRQNLDVVVGKDTIRQVMYDCGSSESDLVLPLEDWKRTTGMTIDSPQVARSYTLSWGDTIPQYLAPARDSVMIAGISLGRPNVEYVAWKNRDMSQIKNIGNHLFYDKYVVLLDMKNSRFGLALSTHP
jgi:hypothetical protein